MDKEQKMITDFMNMSHQVVRNSPTTDISEKEKMLRIRLIVGEVSELIDAISLDDIVEIADAIADTLYVIKGAANVYGIDLEPVFNEVHRSNMTKEYSQENLDKSGKILKGPKFSPPRLHEILQQQVMKKQFGFKYSNENLQKMISDNNE